MPAYLALSCDEADQYVFNDILPNLIEIDTDSPAAFVIEEMKIASSQHISTGMLYL